MTTRGRYGGARHKRPSLRVIGTPQEVATIVGRLAHVVDIVSQSKEIPRREEPGRVSVYLDLSISDGPQG